jgi:hypothetical protein
MRKEGIIREGLTPPEPVEVADGRLAKQAVHGPLSDDPRFSGPMRRGAEVLADHLTDCKPEETAS